MFKIKSDFVFHYFKNTINNIENIGDKKKIFIVIKFDINNNKIVTECMNNIYNTYCLNNKNNLYFFFILNIKDYISQMQNKNKISEGFKKYFKDNISQIIKIENDINFFYAGLNTNDSKYFYL